MVHVLQSETMLANCPECGIMHLHHFGVFTKGELVMFSLEEWNDVAAAMVVQIKSVERLARKEGQPDSVANEYRNVHRRLLDVSAKVVAERDKVAAIAKAQVKK